MYDQDDTPVLRQILRLVLVFVIVALVLWLLVWLIFFRNNSAHKVVAPTKPTTQQHKSGSGNSSTGSGSGSSAPAPSGAGSTASGSASQPTQLANTGAGNVLLVAAVATIAGSVSYHVYIRKKLEA